MSPAEWFLLSWAMLATLVMGYYHYRLQRAQDMMYVSSRIFVGLADGSTVIKRTQDGVVFTNLTEESHNEIRIQNRQG